MKKIFLAITIVFGATLWLTFASPSAAQEESQPIRVAINPVEPFIILDGPEPQGFSIDLWDAIANEAGIEYEWIEVENVSALLEAVESGNVDLGIGATSITSEREKHVDFSLPFFAAGLQIMTQADQRAGVLGTLRGIFTTNLLGFLGTAFAILLIVAHIAWFIERNNNPAFSGGYWHGILAAFYWTVVTASTVGYGDTVLRDNLGRLLAVVWMLLSLFLVSYFTATVTTSLTLNRLESEITGPENLRGSTIVTLGGTTSANYLQERGHPFIPVENVEAAIVLIQNGQADALVYDAPVLQYYSTRAESVGTKLTPTVFQPENYGIVTPQNSLLREDINQALLRVQENGVYDQIHLRWFGQ